LRLDELVIVVRILVVIQSKMISLTNKLFRGRFPQKGNMARTGDTGDDVLDIDEPNSLEIICFLVERIPHAQLLLSYS
jgi:hypothetical protein